jgi:hypothetical protein
MAKKKSKKQSRPMSRNQKIMAIIGVFIILAMVLPGILTFFQ